MSHAGGTRHAVVRRKGRRVVGIKGEHYARVVKLRMTGAGELSVTAVVASAMEIGLGVLEQQGKMRKPGKEQ